MADWTSLASLLFYLAFFLLECSSPVYGAQLADSLELWPSLNIKVLSSRWWSTDQLRQAIARSGEQQMWPLLDKLNNHQPITVVSLGSSVTGDYAGCFHKGQPEVETVATRAGWLGYTYTSSKCGPILDSGANATNPPDVGWAAQFMGRINATWPHTDHILVNLGCSACSLRNINDAFCLEHMLPKDVDLVIMEQPVILAIRSPNQNAGLTVEQLLRRLQHVDAGRSQPPAVILMNIVSLWDRHNEADRCVTTEHCNGDDCATLDWKKNTNLFVDPESWSEPEANIHAVADAYGITSLSTLKFWASLVRNDGVTRFNMTFCRVILSLMRDGIHPSGDLGRVFYADLLTILVADAQRSWKAAQSSRVVAGQTGRKKALPHMWPAKPVHADGMRFWNMRCFKAILPSKEKAKVSTGQTSTEIPAIDVVRHDGWEFMEFYTSRNGERKYKPGWIAYKPSAVLHVRVNTDFSSDKAPISHDAPNAQAPASNTSTLAGDDAPVAATDVDKDKEVLLILGFLVSYEHMGTARATCVSGCSCSPREFDAHEDVHISRTLLRGLHVTQHPQCIVQLEVLQRTSSGEHQFKLQQLVVKDAAQW